MIPDRLDLSILGDRGIKSRHSVVVRSALGINHGGSGSTSFVAFLLKVSKKSSSIGIAPHQCCFHSGPILGEFWGVWLLSSFVSAGGLWAGSFRLRWQWQVWSPVKWVWIGNWIQEPQWLASLVSYLGSLHDLGWFHSIPWKWCMCSWPVPSWSGYGVQQWIAGSGGTGLGTSLRLFGFFCWCYLPPLLGECFWLAGHESVEGFECLGEIDIYWFSGVLGQILQVGTHGLGWVLQIKGAEEASFDVHPDFLVYLEDSQTIPKGLGSASLDIG